MTAIVLFCWGAQPRSKIAQLQSPRDHGFNPETRMKAVYICFIYVIHIFIVHWLVKRFLEKRKEFHCVYLVFCHPENGCVQHVWFTQNGALAVLIACVMHKRAIIARFIYALEKTIYGLKKTIYGLERLFTAQKRLFTAWGYFCRIVSLFLITWRTFNQSMNKNIQWYMNAVYNTNSDFLAEIYGVG